MLMRAALRRIAIIWVICLVIFSLQPNRAPGTRGRAIPHQSEHVVIFGATAVLLMTLARNRREEWIAAACVVGLAVAIEFAQWGIYRMPGFEWWDVREDSLGILLGLVLVRYSGVRDLILDAGAVERT
jgi:VanZ family protein